MKELFDLSKFRFPELLGDNLLFHDRLSRLLAKLRRHESSIFVRFKESGKTVSFNGITFYLNGELFLGENVKIKPGCVFEGTAFIDDNSVIGPFAYFRGENVIGKNCGIGRSEVKSSLIMDGVKIHHNSYIGDSILGNRVNIAAGFVAANLRFDDETVNLYYRGRNDFKFICDSKRRKFGAVIGDDCKTMVNTYTMPGWVYPKGSVIAYDINRIIQKL